MAVLALEILFYVVDILFEPGGDIAVAATAVDRSGFGLPGHVTAKVGNVRVAARTGVVAMSGSLES